MHSKTYLCPGAKSFLCSCLVGCFALPGCKSRGLECTAIREGQLPRAMDGHLVDGVQIEGGLLLTLASRQEANAWKDRAAFYLYFYINNKLNSISLTGSLKWKSQPYDTHQVQQQGRCASKRSLWPWQPPEGWTSLGRSVQQWPCWASAECPPGTHGGQTEPCTQQPEPKDRWTELLLHMLQNYFWLESNFLLVAGRQSHKRL